MLPNLITIQGCRHRDVKQNREMSRMSNLKEVTDSGHGKKINLEAKKMHPDDRRRGLTGSMFLQLPFSIKGFI